MSKRFLESLPECFLPVAKRVRAVPTQAKTELSLSVIHDGILNKDKWPLGTMQHHLKREIFYMVFGVEWHENMSWIQLVHKGFRETSMTVWLAANRIGMPGIPETLRGVLDHRMPEVHFKDRSPVVSMLRHYPGLVHGIVMNTKRCVRCVSRCQNTLVLYPGREVGVCSNCRQYRSRCHFPVVGQYSIRQFLDEIHYQFVHPQQRKEYKEFLEAFVLDYENTDYGLCGTGSKRKMTGAMCRALRHDLGERDHDVIRDKARRIAQGTMI